MSKLFAITMLVLICGIEFAPPPADAQRAPLPEGPRKQLIYGSKAYKEFIKHFSLGRFVRSTSSVKECGGVCSYPYGLECGCSGGPGTPDICCGEEICQPGSRDCGMTCENVGPCPAISSASPVPSQH